MTTAIKRRRGTTAQHSTFTGLDGELTIDTTKETVVVHDGATAGGFPLLREDLSNNTNVATLSGAQTFSGAKTFSSNPIVNAGLVAGVVYLDNSKALATSTTFVSDGTYLYLNGAQGLSSTEGFVQVVGSYLAQGNNAGLRVRNSTLNGGGSVRSVAGLNGGISLSGDAGPIAFSAGSSERMRLDSSGNLGLGVTPSAYTGSYKALQIGNTAFYAFGTSFGFMGQNVYNDGSNRYISNGQSSVYEQNQGAHRWYTAPSGTAGNAITFTQAMTLNANGNFTLGTTSPSEFSGYITQSINGTSGSFTEWRQNNGNTFRVGSDSSDGGFLFTQGATAIRLGTNGSERARITSAGELLVGTTTPYGARQTIYQTGNAEALWVIADNAAFTDNVLRLDCSRNTTNGTWNFLECTVPGISNRLFIRDSGNVVNANNSYGAISDAKLKENITDATPKLDKLQQIRVVNYNLIGEEQKQIGVIAQEVEQVFPGMVEESSDRDEEGNDLGTTTKSVKYSVFVPMLIKAIQEQQAIITALTARVAALESI